MQHHHHINILGCGLAMGITGGLGMFLLGLTSWLFSWGTHVLVIMSTLYIGYGPTLWGSIIGMLWGFAGYFVSGTVFAWIYNKIVCKHEHHEHTN